MPCYHVFEARHYTNGGGLCALCGVFRSKVFTAVELKQFCYVCGTPTFDKDHVGFVCGEHNPGAEFLERAHMLKESGEHYDEFGNTWAMLVHAWGLAEKGEDARGSLFDS